METITSLRGLEVLTISLGGILCIYLGYRLFMTGTSQPFKIFSDLKGWKFKAANIAPGILFAILGSVIICSPVITNAISILQKEAFINTYATKLILDEIRKRNETIMTPGIEKQKFLKEPGSKISSTTDHPISTKLRESNKAVVMSNGLRLRKKPGTSYKIVGSLRRGDVITVKETRGVWSRVSTAEFTDGWVHGDHIRKHGDSETTDSPETASLLLSSNP